MIWDSNNLFEKAAVYFQRAYAGDREDDQFPLGVTMGFEFLARSALAKIHPALLADPQQGENLLYAFGYPSKNPPKSVPLKTVLHRLTVVVEDFTDDDFKFTTSILEMRNAEVHSADLPFDTFKPNSWLPQLLQICQVLCTFLGKILADLLGEEDAAAAAEMVASLEDKLRTEAREAIAATKKAFESIDVEERLGRIKSAKEELKTTLRWMDKVVKCPACGAEALLRGKVVRVLETRATEDGVEERAIIMPTALECKACDLELLKHGHLFHVGLGDQFTETTLTDPKDYFGIEFDPADYYEPDYGND